MNITQLANEVFLDLKTAYDHERIDSKQELDQMAMELVEDIANKFGEDEDRADFLFDCIIDEVEQQIFEDEDLSDLPKTCKSIDYDL